MVVALTPSLTPRRKCVRASWEDRNSRSTMVATGNIMTEGGGGGGGGEEGGWGDRGWGVEADSLGYVKKREKHKKPLTRNGNKPAKKEGWGGEEEGREWNGTDRIRVWE